MRLLSIAYLPPIEWFAHLLKGDAVIEVCDHYVKQTYRNRCHIATPQGIQALVIPVLHGDSQPGISEQASWRHNHWQALVSAYRMSPFFEYYADDLKPFYDQPRTETLYDYDLSLIRTLCRLMHIEPEIRLSENYITDTEHQSIIDLRDAIHPKKVQKTAISSHETPTYYQVFAAKNGFIGNLSIVDLLFNTGTEAPIYLRDLSKQIC